MATEENSLDAKTFGANRLKFTPVGKRVLITSLGDGDLVIYDTASRKEFKRVKIGHGAAGILMDRDGNRAFIACGPDNYVAVEPPLRMLDAGARERHLPLREARLRRNSDRPRLPQLATTRINKPISSQTALAQRKTDNPKQPMGDKPNTRIPEQPQRSR